MIEFVIEGELPALNEIISASKSHYGSYAKLKKSATKKVKLSCNHIPKIHESAHFTIVYFCKDKRKDMDNVAVAKKFIFDGLVEAKKMKNDGWSDISSWEESFAIDKINPRIVVSIT